MTLNEIPITHSVNQDGAVIKLHEVSRLNIKCRLE